MSRAELKKIYVVEKIIDGLMTNSEGAMTLGISVRQMIRLKNKYKAEGAPGIAHKNRGRKPVHALSDEMKDRTAELYTSKYHGSNSCHFAELLQEHEDIQLSSSSVRRILLAKGLKQAKQRRRTAHQPRQRRAQAGMLWQIDATPYAWLEDRAPAFALHAAIDDATGIVVGAVFRPNECREGYSLVMQQGMTKYGVPLGLYSDRHTIFRSPNEKLTVEQELAGESKPLSNFGKAMAELGIEHIQALSPQAKGRIERLWVTFQDRLVIELRLLGITTMEAANEALPLLIQKHNQRFAVAPRSSEPAYMELSEDIRLEHVFTVREYRTLGAGQTLSYGGNTYTFAESLPQHFPVKTVVEVRETLTGDVLVWHQGQALLLKKTERPERQEQTKKASSAQPRKPAKDHPWKTTYDTTVTKRSTKRDSFQDAMYSQHNSYSEAYW
ncbi:ISNCY family transposase [Paenibacillus sp. J2TS4]|uniref:ISNCY family transposase n=1 Tax=Paenibacillus sp. J2TS4 TaxID=2807194 RepID=UPI001B18895C|nr:ISNCY family transposase [Paenibacillus sp. J2TS4]GIP36717.1 transposase [Paenibacillus sp. J2TS4]